MAISGILTFILILALVGFVIWAITTYIPMPDIIKKVIYVVVVIFVVLWLISMLGGGGSFPSLRWR